MTDLLYILGDGDEVRKRIEFYLLSGDLEQLSAFSSALTEAIQELKHLAVLTLDSKIIFAGGDDILFVTKLGSYQDDKLRVLMIEFFKRTRSTISFGVGPSIESAFVNLRRAKAKGPDSLVTSGTK